MTAFPELEHALVDAARRRYGRMPRTWRIVRPVLVAAAAATAVAAIVLVPDRTTTEERPAPAVAKADLAERRYGVLRRPVTSADALPSVGHFKRFWLFREDRRGFDPSRTRLAARAAPWSVYLVPATMGRLPSLCTVAIMEGAPWVGGCAALALPRNAIARHRVLAYSVGRTEPGFLFTVRDGIDALTLTLADGSTLDVPVRDNVALYTGAPAAARAAWTWAGERHSRKLVRPTPPGERRP